MLDLLFSANIKSIVCKLLLLLTKVSFLQTGSLEEPTLADKVCRINQPLFFLQQKLMQEIIMAALNIRSMKFPPGHGITEGAGAVKEHPNIIPKRLSK